MSLHHALRVPVRAVAVAVALLVVASACGSSSDPAAEEGTPTTPAEVTSTTVASTSTAPMATAAPSTSLAADDETGDSPTARCDALDAPELAAAAGSTVTTTRDYDGHVDHETLLLNLRGCLISLEDGNELVVTRAYDRDDDQPLDSAGFEAFRAEEAAYERGPVDDSYPYAEVADLGVPAFFAGSNTSHDLFLDLGDQVLYLTCRQGPTAMDRDALAAVGAGLADQLG